jgi:hypothetical protein
MRSRSAVFTSFSLRMRAISFACAAFAARSPRVAGESGGAFALAFFTVPRGVNAEAPRFRDSIGKRDGDAGCPVVLMLATLSIF